PQGRPGPAGREGAWPFGAARGRRLDGRRGGGRLLDLLDLLDAGHDRAPSVPTRVDSDETGASLAPGAGADGAAGPSGGAWGAVGSSRRSPPSRQAYQKPRRVTGSTRAAWTTRTYARAVVAGMPNCPRTLRPRKSKTPMYPGEEGISVPRLATAVVNIAR